MVTATGTPPILISSGSSTATTSPSSPPGTRVTRTREMLFGGILWAGASIGAERIAHVVGSYRGTSTGPTRASCWVLRHLGMDMSEAPVQILAPASARISVSTSPELTELDVAIAKVEHRRSSRSPSRSSQWCSPRRLRRSDRSA